MGKYTKKQFYTYVALTVVLIGIAAFLYFVHLDYDKSFINDEFQSVSVAYNVSEGLGLVRNDHMDGYKSYTRGWPSTYLLAGWMKLFGVSEISCRSLSALYGVLFLLSVLYVSYKFSKNYSYSLLTVLMLTTVEHVTKYFRTVRMYSLGLLIGIWLFYFTFLFLTNPNPFWKNRNKENNSKKAKTIMEWLDYDWRFFPIVLLLIFLSYENIVNGVIPLGGMTIFIVLMAIKKKEPKYIFATVVEVVAFVIAILNFVYFHFAGNYLFAAKVFKKFAYYAGFGFQKEYIKYIVDMNGSRYITLGLCLLLLIMVVLSKEIEEELLYLFSIFSFTLTFFACFSMGRYDFRERYILDLVPWAIMFFLFSVVKIGKKKLWLSNVIFALLSIIPITMLYTEVKTFGFSVNEYDHDYLMAYNTVSEYYDLENDTVPLVGSYVRSYYANQVFNKLDYKELKRAKAFDQWLTYAERNPEGIISCEDIKIHKLLQNVPQIIFGWTDLISGNGIDPSGVFVAHYCFLYGETSSEDVPTGAYLSDDGIKIVFDSSSVDTINGIGKEKKMVFVALVLNENGNTTVRNFGLRYSDEYEESDTVTYFVPKEYIHNIDFESIEDAFVAEHVGVYVGTKLVDPVNIYE